MFLYAVLPVLTLICLILLVVFVSQFLRDIQMEYLAEKHLRRVGISAALVFVSLLVMRMFAVAVIFLLAVLLLMLIILTYAKKSRQSGGAEAGTAEDKHFKLVNLEKYTRHIRSKQLVKRIIRINGVVGSIRSIADYDAKSLAKQSGDILRMEKVYLPRIESLLNQYIKISSHDRNYDIHKLTEQLDIIVVALKQILEQCLKQDKFTIDVEASALITAMQMDGLGDSNGKNADFEQKN